MRELAIEYIRDLGSYVRMVWHVLRDLFAARLPWAPTRQQIIKLGLNSLPIILLTAIFTGMVLALQTAYGMQRFGAKTYVGNITSLAMIRELGPVLTALMLCGRVGAGIAAEIASMVATEQVDAIRVLGANPIRKLVTPRVIAVVLVMPVLCIIANVIGIYGGGLMAVLELNLSAHTYYKSILQTILIRDLIDGLIKSTIFGFLVVSIACWKGLHTRGGTVGVGNTTTSAVVTGSVVILISDFFITKFLLLL
jgi:phospholipid/cholesterol/gamma-HCH transport system permease protein